MVYYVMVLKYWQFKEPPFDYCIAGPFPQALASSLTSNQHLLDSHFSEQMWQATGAHGSVPLLTP